MIDILIDYAFDYGCSIDRNGKGSYNENGGILSSALEIIMAMRSEAKRSEADMP
jgi:hypothetical protein